MQFNDINVLFWCNLKLLSFEGESKLRFEGAEDICEDVVHQLQPRRIRRGSKQSFAQDTVREAVDIIPHSLLPDLADTSSCSSTLTCLIYKILI